MWRSLAERFAKKKRPLGRTLLREPVRLVGAAATIAVGETQRRALEETLGPGVEYPAPGWNTWAVDGERGERWLLSTFFRTGTLLAVEYYLPKITGAPAYLPRVRSRFVVRPGDVALGNATRSLPDAYQAVTGRPGGVQSVVYGEAFDARWAGGVALISGNDGRIERIALYGKVP